MKLFKLFNYSETFMVGRVAQWIRHQASNLGIAGSSPAVVEFFYGFFSEDFFW